MNKGVKYFSGFLLAVALFLTASTSGPAVLAGKDILKITFLNVRQGDSAVIQTPDNKVIVIDGGQLGTRYSRFDAGEEVLIPFLEKEGIKKIDMVVATHPDYDHMGGLVALLNSDIKVDEVLDCGVPHTTGTYKAYVKAIKGKKIPLKIPEKGEVLNWGDKLRAQVIAPQVPPEKRMNRNLNNNSIVIKLDYGEVSFLLTGDCEHEEEHEILGSGARLKADIYKASHHGSRTGSGEVFYYLTDPEVAIISCGKRNKFDHPHWEPIKLFRETGAEILRTDYHGDITVITDGKTYEILED